MIIATLEHIIVPAYHQVTLPTHTVLLPCNGVFVPNHHIIHARKVFVLNVNELISVVTCSLIDLESVCFVFLEELSQSPSQFSMSIHYIQIILITQLKLRIEFMGRPLELLSLNLSINKGTKNY